MKGHMPTRLGDVLILYNNSVPTHVVEAISEDGQQGLNANHQLERGRAPAIAAAKGLVMAGCRIYIKNTDTEEWDQFQADRKSTRLTPVTVKSRMPSSA